jgi:[ribosomal protein S18]-alanine N-acetyltransferase
VTCEIHAMRSRDVRHVLVIERQAFPHDPWTAETGKGWLARATGGGRARHAAGLARFIRFIRLHQATGLIRLIRLLVLDQPPGLTYIVAEADDREIVGYACLRAVGGEARIPIIAVRPDRQGQQIGTHLLNKLIAMAMAGGCREMSLYVRADNSRARRLYRRTGFAEVGVRPGFYQPSGTDAVVMRLRAPGAENRVHGEASDGRGARGLSSASQPRTPWSCHPLTGDSGQQVVLDDLKLSRADSGAAGQPVPLPDAASGG